MEKYELNEELHIDGAEYLGSDYGYDVYDIKTFAAAQEFNVAGDANAPAGNAWAQSAEKFDQYITNSTSGQKIIFFAAENTKAVYLGVLTHASGRLSIQPSGATIHSNCSFEAAQTGSNFGSTVAASAVFPLYLIPEFSATNASNENGIITDLSNRTEIIGTYCGLVPSSQFSTNSEISLEGYTKIANNCFGFYKAAAIKVTESVQKVEAQAFTDYSGKILLPYASEESLPEGWDADWAGQNHGELVWSSTEAASTESETSSISDTAVEISTSQDEPETEEQRKERLRRLHDTRVANIQTMPIEEVLTYKEDKDGITILGCSPLRAHVVIPEEINGKPVIAIAPFAFYKHLELQKAVLPKTLKEIGKGAFAGCAAARISYPRNPKLKIYRDAFRGVYSAYAN